MYNRYTDKTLVMAKLLYITSAKISDQNIVVISQLLQYKNTIYTENEKINVTLPQIKSTHIKL